MQSQLDFPKQKSNFEAKLEQIREMNDRLEAQMNDPELLKLYATLRQQIEEDRKKHSRS